LKFILIRIALGILSLFAVSVLIFAATEILPGDVASAVLGQGATPETLAAFRHELGLDRPALVVLELADAALHLVVAGHPVEARDDRGRPRIGLAAVLRDRADRVGGAVAIAAGQVVRGRRHRVPDGVLTGARVPALLLLLAELLEAVPLGEAARTVGGPEQPAGVRRMGYAGMRRVG